MKTVHLHMLNVHTCSNENLTKDRHYTYGIISFGSNQSIYKTIEVNMNRIVQIKYDLLYVYNIFFE